MVRRMTRISTPALRTWRALNKVLRECRESVAQRLLHEELHGLARKQFLLRIHSRLNYLRASRERRQLIKERTHAAP